VVIKLQEVIKINIKIKKTINLRRFIILF